jgi:hypothetical protein
MAKSPTSNLQPPISNLQSPISNLQPHLHRWGLRLRLAESLTWGPWGAAAGLGAGLLLALAARLCPLLIARVLVGWVGLLMLAGGIVGLAAVWLRPRSLASSARAFDRRFRLAERLTTAVEIGTGRLRTAPAMARAQLADALNAAVRVDPGVMLPLRASRRALLVSGVLVVALLFLLWLPNPQEDVLLQRAAVRAAIEGQVEELEAVREAVAEAEGLTEAEREVLLQVLEEAIAALNKSLDRSISEGRTAPEEAVAALSEAERALAPLHDPGAATVQAGLERAAEEMADSELTHDIAEALANGDYQTAAQALAAYSGEQGETLTQEEELELARELAEAAETLAESASPLQGGLRGVAKQLAQAAEAIERGDIAEAREAIRGAAQRMGEAGERVQRQEVVEGTLAELQEGREQIANGCSLAGAPLAQSLPDAGRGGGQQTQPGHHEDAGTGAPYDEVYVPYRFDEEGVGVGVGREGDEGVSVGDVPLPAPEGGRTSVPYREVYADYAAQAGAALEGSYIPLGLKQYVRDYFSSLEP